MRPGDFLCARFPLKPTGFFGLLFGRDRLSQTRARTLTGRGYTAEPHVLIGQLTKDEAALADSCTAQILSHSITSSARMSGVCGTPMPSGLPF